MRQPSHDYLFPGAFAPALSLNDLLATQGEDGSDFDIRDDESLKPDEAMENAQLEAALDQFISGLPLGDQQIMHRHFWLGETQASIAASLQVSRMAISKRIARICKDAREFLLLHHHNVCFH